MTSRSSFDQFHSPMEPASHCPDTKRISRLARLFEREIIPRLLICHRVTRRARPGTAEIAELARLMLHPERELADAYLESFSRRGASRGVICAELLAPTARHLAELWECEACDFHELAVGLGRIETVLHEFRRR